MPLHKQIIPDYTGVSIIVPNPHLNIEECGLPITMALRLFEPFIIHHLIENKVANTIVTAKKLIEKYGIDILEKLLKDHPVLLSHSETLHRFSIQVFKAKLVDGKAIEVSPFIFDIFKENEDKEMTVHVPLTQTAIAEAKSLMLASKNLLNPLNSKLVVEPAQDMVLGLYYLTKQRVSNKDENVKGEGKKFYGAEEVMIAFQEKVIDVHASIQIKVPIKQEDESLQIESIQTTTGRVIFNQIVPNKIGFINKLLTKEELINIVTQVIEEIGIKTAGQLLDKVKLLGFNWAFKSGLSFTLKGLGISNEKQKLIKKAKKESEEPKLWYDMGIITDKEQYNQVIDIWVRTTNRIGYSLLDNLAENQQGFNIIYMMENAGIDLSKNQISRISGIYGLTANYTSNKKKRPISEHPILSNFKDGLSPIDYFLSSHRYVKKITNQITVQNLASSLAKLTQNAIIREGDCGTVNGIDIFTKQEIIDSVSVFRDRAIHRIALNNIVDPITQKTIVKANQEITKKKAKIIEQSNIYKITVRSPLTCKTPHGICAKCYGRNLSNNKFVKIGDVVGSTVALSIAESTKLIDSTQMFWFPPNYSFRNDFYTFSRDDCWEAKIDGLLQFEGLKSVNYTNDNPAYEAIRHQVISLGRMTKGHILDPITKEIKCSFPIPYGATLHAKEGLIKKGQTICRWGIYYIPIIAEGEGIVHFENIIENETFHTTQDDQTGHKTNIIISPKNKILIPKVHIKNKKEQIIYTSKLPIGAELLIKDHQKIKAGETIAYCPRFYPGRRGKIKRLQILLELLKVKKPKNPTFIAQIDGIITKDSLEKDHRAITITSKNGQTQNFKIPLSNYFLWYENNFVSAGTELTDGDPDLNDLFKAKGFPILLEYFLGEIQTIYKTVRYQPKTIKDKHLEMLLRQMLQKAVITDAGDTHFIKNTIENRFDIIAQNDELYQKKIITDIGDSKNFKKGQQTTLTKIIIENYRLQSNNLKLLQYRNFQGATYQILVLGI